MNRSVLIERTGKHPHVTMIEESIPAPKADEVIVRVHYCGVANADLMMINGSYLGQPKPPFTPGYDLVGEVVGVGRNVSSTLKGEYVAALTETGAYTQYTALPVEETIPCETAASLAQLACLPLNYTTAYQLLFRTAHVQSGDLVLIQGGSGGVGSALMDLCRLHGVKAIATGSTASRSYIESFGSSFIDYNDHLGDALKQHGIHEVQAVFDPVGPLSWKRGFDHLSTNGTLAIYGLIEGNYFAAGLQGLRLKICQQKKAVRVYFIAMERKKRHDRLKEDLQQIITWFEEGKLQPTISSIYSLADFREAHEAFRSRGKKGKILLKPNG
ncbi:zinc-binding dehydrogenase [Salsuginibacillus kocurii]|uniref:zinc-binding dehydrogenase n=1 Tax=Salsuginibacillus kocurii TaxID=427078 RepID=UPI00037A486D|nr:zinc-binding dehydrogenase [Salsuginibacillus kocurii]